MVIQYGKLGGRSRSLKQGRIELCVFTSKAKLLDNFITEWGYHYKASMKDGVLNVTFPKSVPETGPVRVYSG